MGAGSGSAAYVSGAPGAALSERLWSAARSGERPRQAASSGGGCSLDTCRCTALQIGRLVPGAAVAAERRTGWPARSLKMLNQGDQFALKAAADEHCLGAGREG
jgi:hypothetical protein